MTLDDIFSEDNMLKYSGVCLDLAVNIPEAHKNTGFDTLLIPSRGAVPIFLGMVYALEKLVSFGGDHKDFYRNLGIQELISPLLPELSSAPINNGHRTIKSLFIPFTADLHISKFSPGEDDDRHTIETRRYWAKVTSSFFKSQSSRLKDPAFRSFTDLILRDIEGRGQIAEMYESFDQIKKMTLIDTVISGMASTNILQAFDQIAFQEGNSDMIPDSFLVVTENGAKLRHPFLPYLRKKEIEGKVKMYRIPRIVSEDQGASLLGVASLVYPSIMQCSRKLRQKNNNSFYIGAGSWRLASDLGELSDDYSSNFQRFMNLVYAGIDHLFSKEYLGEDNESLEAFIHERNKFVENALNTRILSHGHVSVEPLNLNREYNVKMPYETSSHVAHIPFDEKSTSRILSKFCASTPEVYCIDENPPKNH